MQNSRLFFNFLKRFQVEKTEITIKDFFFWVIVFFLFGGILFWYPVRILEELGVISELVERKFEFEYSFFVASAVFISPVLEEMIFRFPLKYFLNKSYFKYVVWLSIVLFGLIHVTNYELRDEHFFFLPVILASQLWGGMMLSFIRLKFGIITAILMHSSYNILCLVWDNYIGF